MIRSKRRSHDLLKKARSDKEGPLPTQGRPDLLRRGHNPSRGKGLICNSKSNKAEPPQMEPQGPNYHSRHVSRLSHHQSKIHQGRPQPVATKEVAASFIKEGHS